MAASLERYAPHVPLPPYRYLPGVSPHPRRDPRGHMFGRADVLPPRLAPDAWRANEAYLLGVDYFNFAYWWEAHEVWEGVWRVEPDDAIARDFLKGLIQAAGALLKRHVSAGRVGESLARSSAALLARVERAAPGGVYMGLDLRAWLPAFVAFFDQRADDSALAGLVIRLRLGER